uniref:phosphoglycerate mutase n=1 Tax=Synarthrophyton patena TaxID=48972 RepID=UPI00218203BD|nr:phosphoglycerate mutase [Synarthrophyton patena]UVF63000.1 phosphoglycerate mutase [Synarthrophyton patena]
MKDQRYLDTVILIILDGWGYSPIHHGNAIKQAYTPNLTLLWNKFPTTLLQASSDYVGLPKNQMGNSEVGHTTIGAGRIINQDLARINQSIFDKTFFSNYLLNSIYKNRIKQNQKVHIIGLCSDGGVHSHINHLIALIKISQKYKKIETCIHIITDGRDTKPQKAKFFINHILNIIKNQSHIKICTISGRYYSMDRDCRWSRTEKIYRCLIEDQIIENYYNDPIKLIDSSYKNNIFDEFIIPTRINKGKIEDKDSVLFFNFRPDRIKQLVQAFTSNLFKGFNTKKFETLNINTFTSYDSKLNLPIIFPKISKNNFLGQIISENNLKQFRLAETEKYAHITYFFNGGQEEPYSGEDRELIPSPQVDFYDSTPQMSAIHITQKIIEAKKKNIYKLIVANYANADMIGHTGNFKATKNSIEILDQCIGNILKEIKIHKTTLIITADHGNAEEMIDINNKPCKSHTKNAVPFILIKPNYSKIITNKLKNQGSLADISPTILDILKINKPKDMNGISLINDESSIN